VQNLNGKFQTLTGAFAEILNNMVDLIALISMA